MFIPDTVRFLLVVAALAGAVYGGACALATFPPEQTESRSNHCPMRNSGKANGQG